MLTETLAHQRDANDDDLGLDLIEIPAGSFLMGSSPGTVSRNPWREEPQHEVTIATFCMSRYTVTQAQWQTVAAMEQVTRELDPDPSCFKGDDRPVECVSWNEAVEFCQRLSRFTGQNYRLPSEAEWEYACRAGTTTNYSFGDEITPEQSNYDHSGAGNGQTTNVGSFPPNAFGLYDMHGNVWEWCEDSWHRDYEGAPTDGSAWVDTDAGSIYRVCRGGSWYSFPGLCRSAYRESDTPFFRYNNTGFRVCKS